MGIRIWFVIFIRFLIGDVDWVFGCINLEFKRKDVSWKY